MFEDSRAQAPRLRLTRRGRRAIIVVAAAAVLCLSAAVMLAGTGDAGATVEQASTPSPRSHVLTPGETLWDVAVRFFPHTDPRETVVRLEEVNHLDSALVPAGRLLRLPDRPPAEGLGP